MKTTILTLLLAATFNIANAKMLATTPPKDRFFVQIVCLEKVPIVEVQLNGDIAFFLLDSGSDISMLNKADTDKYQFTITKTSTKDLRGFSGGFQALHHTTGTRLMLDDHDLNVTFLAANLDRLVQAIKAYSSIEIAGIIGLDIMKAYGFEIDYADGVLRFNP